MKIKFNKKKYVSLILMFLMLGSTITFGALQAFRTWRQPESTPAPELPATNVVAYEITAKQRNYMLRLGRTILEYRYQLACAECADQRGYIEAAARDFPDQIFVQEIVDNSANNPTLAMTSYYGDELLTNPSNEEILDALCRLMTDPPIICATMNV